MVVRSLAAMAVAVVCTAARADDGSLVEAQASCTALHARFPEAWTCIRERIAAGHAGAMNNAPGLRYIARGDLLSEQAGAHAITDAAARAYLAGELARGDADYRAGQAAAAGSGPVICSQVGTTTFCNR